MLIDSSSTLQLLHVPREDGPGNLRASSLISNVAEWMPVDESGTPFKVNLRALPFNSLPALVLVACCLPALVLVACCSLFGSVDRCFQSYPSSFVVHHAHMQSCRWELWRCSFPFPTLPAAKLRGLKSHITNIRALCRDVLFA